MLSNAQHAYFTLVGLTKPGLGDVNGDEEINITDVISLVNHILGKEEGNFIIENADINTDGDINISDATALVNVILGGGNFIVNEVVTNIDDFPITFGGGNGTAKVRENR